MNLNKLKGKMRENGYTYERIANKIGIKTTTMTFRMKGTKEFRQTEIKTLIEILGLSAKETMEIFF